MKGEQFIVVFQEHGIESVYCFNTDEARILAQAKRIGKGMDYQVDKVMKIDDWISEQNRSNP